MGGGSELSYKRKKVWLGNLMSVWASFKRAAPKPPDPPKITKPRKSSSYADEFDAGFPFAGKEEAGIHMAHDDGDEKPRKSRKAFGAFSSSSSSCAPIFDAMLMGSNFPAKEQDPQSLESEDHDYIRDNCIVPREQLKTFAHIIGNESVMNFAESYEPVARGAVRPVSGLLLYGPPGTGKSSGAQAIAHYLKGTFYSFSAADLPNGKAGAVRIDALFDVAMAGELPAIIFIDEVDTILSARAQSRVGHFAGRFSRFTDNLLVIGATNNPELIAEKILTGRFERKILIDTPDADARRSLLLRQLAQDDQPHALQSQDIHNIVAKTAGRSAVNLERLISTAVAYAHGQPVTYPDFEEAMETEPSDYDPRVAARHAKFDKKFGWRG